MNASAKFLEAFPTWLHSLADDAVALAALIDDPSVPEQPRRCVTGALNHVFKTLDILPEGLDVGFLDDAFVLRVAADHASRSELDGVHPEKLQALGRLADECEVVREFLGPDFERLERYVEGLRRASVRGRSFQDVADDAEVRTAFLAEVRDFAQGYQAPAFSREDKNLVKLRAFYDAKLPR